ncbi:MAG TPA: hypothetical protein VG317_08610 [Pseudonocardiaceae bacterium]|jgi:NAD(P)-dependent dehydrogenase (short-subunit alcohol dehydrogenase family)|nr:hypothetical protein [Pseudonocardiaceae bacterium]
MAVRRALILTGTGMLASVTATLVAEGWRVVAPCRRYAPLPAYGVPQPRAERGQLLWVPADWEQPADLVKRVHGALGGPADLLVAWVSRRHRVDVLSSVAGLLAAGAPVVDVVDGDGLHGGWPVLDAHPTQQVVLGEVAENDRRWPTHEEIVVGVLAAVRRAVAGGPPTMHYVGERQTV